MQPIIAPATQPPPPVPPTAEQQAQSRGAALLLAKHDLRYFMRLCFKTLNPATTFTPNWHLDYLCYTLQRTLPASHPLNPTPNDPIRRLIINVPPRTLKSELTSVALPAWLIGHLPHKRILKASYNNALAEKLNIKTRRITQQPWYQEMFPNVIPSEPSRNTRLADTAADFETYQQGYCRATSPKSGIIGFGGNYIFIDDPITPEEAKSADWHRYVNTEWFEESIYSRLDQPEQDVIVVIMQRLRHDDLSGYLLAKNEYLPPNEQWFHVKLPARATNTTTYHYYNTSHTFQENDMLTPRIPLHAFEQKFRASPLSASGQLQQEPTLSTEAIIPIEHLQTPPPALPDPSIKPVRIIQSWDTAIKATHRSDYSCCITAFEYEQPHRHTVIKHVLLKKMEYPELLPTISQMANTFKATAILIEDKGSGQQAIQDLRTSYRHLPVIPITPTKDKVTRAVAIEPALMTDTWHLPADHSAQAWWPEFYTQITTFPLGSHDDAPDALTQLVSWQQRTYDNHFRIRVL